MRVKKDDWYRKPEVETLGALFVYPRENRLEYLVKGDLSGKKYTQLQLMNFVDKRLRSRSLQVIPVEVGNRQFGIICSVHELHLDEGIKRSFAFVKLLKTGQIEGLSLRESKILENLVTVEDQEVQGYLVARGILDKKIKLL